MFSPTPSTSPEGSPDAKNVQSKNTRRQEYLKVANKTFTSVEAVSRLIPIVGGYIGAAAKGMDSNDEAAQGLQERTSRLSDILERFKRQCFEPERATTTKLISDLQV
ncbi:hypothetical protein FRC01_012835 [Tulasnella sp. 417]|nr:hypothetical protein FRC01_012835 [Tulasnella sp. 417]